MNPEFKDRAGDDDPRVKLRIFEDAQGDVHVSIVRQGVILTDPNLKAEASVRFCGPGGGNMSPETLKALRALVQAIERDNQERPQPR